MKKLLLVLASTALLSACSGTPMFGASAPEAPKEGYKLVCTETGGWGIGSFKFGGDKECEEVPLED